jgi:hypothetical protein
MTVQPHEIVSLTPGSPDQPYDGDAADCRREAGQAQYVLGLLKGFAQHPLHGRREQRVKRALDGHGEAKRCEELLQAKRRKR